MIALYLITPFLILIYRSRSGLSRFWIAKHFFAAWLSSTLSVAGVLTVVATTTWLIWTVRIVPPYVLGGIMPVSDSSIYVHGAEHLLEFGYVPGLNGQRLIHTVFIAFLMELVNQNSYKAIFLLAIFAGVVISLATLHVLRHFGPIVTSWFVVTLLLFFEMHAAGSFMSENLGFLLGALSLCVLVSAINRESLTEFIVGTFVLSVGLVSRPGAFMVLPCLLIFGMKFFTAKGKLPVGILLSAAVVSPFLLNWTALELLVHEAQTGFSNFSSCVYGLARGGVGWAALYTEHPEISSLSGAALERATYQLALTEIHSNPFNLLLGCLASIYRLTIVGEMFDYVPSPARLLICQLPTCLGLVWIVRTKTEPASKFLLYVMAGILASCPVLVDGGGRVFAVTVPFTALLAAIGWHPILNLLKIGRVNTTNNGIVLSNSIRCVALALTSIVIAAPFMFWHRALPKATDNQSLSCGDGSKLVQLRLSVGSFITILDSSDGKKHELGQIDLEHWQRTPSVVYPGDRVRIVPHIRAGDALWAGLDRIRKNYIYVRLPAAWIPEKENWYQVCVREEIGRLYSDAVNKPKPSGSDI